MNFIQYGAGADVTDEEFREEYEDLTKRWKRTLSKSKKIKGVATLFN
jgi:Ribonuclease G/E